MSDGPVTTQRFEDHLSEALARQKEVDNRFEKIETKIDTNHTDTNQKLENRVTQKEFSDNRTQSNWTLATLVTIGIAIFGGMSVYIVNQIHDTQSLIVQQGHDISQTNQNVSLIQGFLGKFDGIDVKK